MAWPTEMSIPVSQHGSSMQFDRRVDVLGSKVSCQNRVGALQFLGDRVKSGAGGYVCFTNVHAVVTGLQDHAFQDITNASCMSLPDGMPIYWVARSCPGIGHVPGPDFMLAALQRFRRERHYFYGATPETLEKLSSSLRAKIPDLNIVGMFSPPFRGMTPKELEAHYEQIRISRASLVWVGLGAPKQERWMAAASAQLRPAILLGVGAAFDFHANVVPRAPKFMRKLGLEWLHRLIRQPKKLWRRYLVTNTRFVVNIFFESVRRAVWNGKRDL